MKRLWLGIIFYSLCVTFAFADYNSHLYEQANKLYEQGNYADAILKYEEILSGGHESWEVYYNLGNAYYKNKQLGKSILNYERAKSLNNKNEDILFNLELANLMVVDKISVPPEFMPFKVFSTFKNYFRLNALTWIVVFIYLAIIGFLILRFLIRKRAVQKLSAVIIIPVAIILIMFTAILGIRIYEHTTIKHAIILTEKVTVMGAPEINATEIFSLHEGVKVQIQKQIGNWYLIRLIDGKVGWIKKDMLDLI